MPNRSWSVGKGAHADTELITTLRHVIEICDAVRQFHRMVVRKQVAERSESNLLSCSIGPAQSAGRGPDRAPMRR